MKQHLERALAQKVDWVGDHSMYTLLADGAARQHDLAGLKQYSPLAEEAASRIDHRLYLAISHRAWGVLHGLSGDTIQAKSRLEASLVLFQELGAGWQTALSLAELGHIAEEESNPEQASDYYGKALSLFDKMGAKPDGDRVREKMAAMGS